MLQVDKLQHEKGEAGYAEMLQVDKLRHKSTRPDYVEDVAG